MKYFLVVVMVLLYKQTSAQGCIELGQNPGSAFPVCGSTSFSQTSVPLCGSRQVPAPCTNSAAIFMDKNPFWYRFTCFVSGTLGFEIIPNNVTSDYDWQLFDITNRNPSDIYTDRTMFVACNWSGETGTTGASAIGTSLVVCDGTGMPLYSKMPDLQQGRLYLLLVSHFTNSQSGYQLNFGGGTASITDTAATAFTSAKPTCNGTNIAVKLNKKVACNSLVSNGSDFTLTGGNTTIRDAVGVGCANNFDTDSIVFTLARPMDAGNYNITTKKGSDSNTLLDNCQVAMAEGISARFTVNSLQPTAFDSIVAVGCAPGKLVAIFNKPLLCSSVSANGSDFTIDAASGVTITGATVTCNNNVTSSLTLNLSAPITKKGNFKVTLVKGSDGNTIIDECNQETPVGETVTISTTDVVSAAINYTIQYGCKADTVQFSNSGANNIQTWRWQFNERANSNQQNPLYIFTKFGPQVVSLFVSNGVCSDSLKINFDLDNGLVAAFTSVDLLCPKDAATFRDSSLGKITSWKWKFGNGLTSNQKNPPVQNYPELSAIATYNIQLIIGNQYNCFDTLSKKLTVLNSCYIAVPSAFTPNGDGLNDYLYPLNAFKTTNLLFRVYNRVGKLIFETTDHSKKWNGTYKGVPLQSGTFVYTLQYTNSDTGQPFFLKGTTVLLR